MGNGLGRLDQSSGESKQTKFHGTESPVTGCYWVWLGSFHGKTDHLPICGQSVTTRLKTWWCYIDLLAQSAGAPDANDDGNHAEHKGQEFQAGTLLPGSHCGIGIRCTRYGVVTFTVCELEAMAQSK